MNDLTPQEELAQTDHKMARVTEALIAALVQKGVIGLVDLPAPVRAIVAERKRLRDLAEA